MTAPAPPDVARPPGCRLQPPPALLVSRGTTPCRQSARRSPWHAPDGGSLSHGAELITRNDPRGLCQRGSRWSGCRDLNPGPPRPERGALPSCATSRGHRRYGTSSVGSVPIRSPAGQPRKVERPAARRRVAPSAPRGSNCCPALCRSSCSKEHKRNRMCEGVEKGHIARGLKAATAPPAEPAISPPLGAGRHSGMPGGEVVSRSAGRRCRCDACRSFSLSRWCLSWDRL